MDTKQGSAITRLRRRSPTLFLLGGILLVGYAALNGLIAFTGQGFVLVEDVIAPAGFLLGFIGALGLYGELADDNPLLSRFGVLCLLIGITGFSLITAHGVAVLAGLSVGSLPIVMLLLVAVGMIPGYLAFGIASLRNAGQPQMIGLLLLLPAVVFATMLTQPFVYSELGIFTETTMAWSNFAISSGQALAHLAIAYSLRGHLPRTLAASPSPDGTAG